jgi:hypothetical protein
MDRRSQPVDRGRSRLLHVRAAHPLPGHHGAASGHPPDVLRGAPSHPCLRHPPGFGSVGSRAPDRSPERPLRWGVWWRRLCKGMMGSQRNFVLTGAKVTFYSWGFYVCGAIPFRLGRAVRFLGGLDCAGLFHLGFTKSITTTPLPLKATGAATRAIGLQIARYLSPARTPRSPGRPIPPCFVPLPSLNALNSV